MNSLTIVFIALAVIRNRVLADDCNGENPSLLRYYYDPTSKSCNKITLTVPVPVGQTNVFDSEFTCKTLCTPTLDARCNPLTDAVRMTSASSTRTIYQYQKLKTKDSCVAVNIFSSYEQLPVGQNIFPTQAACTAACVKNPVCSVANPVPTVSYYYDSASNRCVQFSSSVPRQPGSNMFDSSAECETACKPDPLARCKPTDPAIRVTAASAKQTGYYTFVLPRTCKALTYGGYVTIPIGTNAFATDVACDTKCKVTPVRNRPAYCSIASVSTDAWYFDGTLCIAFKMTVPLSPLGNAFATEAECNKACFNAGQPECNPPANSAVSPTTASQTKYSFDELTNACKPVVYGGTGTVPQELNFFDDLATCVKSCSKPSECSASEFPSLPGKYFYDQISKSCTPVDLRVPMQSGSNVFESRSECTKKCLTELEPECDPASSDNRVTADSVNRKLYTYSKKRNSCDLTTYNGVVTVPDSSNFFDTKTICEDRCLKSTTAVSTTAVPTTSGVPGVTPLKAIRDAYLECCAWASLGECDRNPLHMKAKCQESCGTPGATEATAFFFVTKVPNNCRLPVKPFKKSKKCADLDVRCNSWNVIGQCTNNEPFMKINCKATCKKCK